MIHELVGHAVPMATNKNGEAIINENKVRREKGWKERDPKATDDPCY